MKKNLNWTLLGLAILSACSSQQSAVSTTPNAAPIGLSADETKATPPPSKTIESSSSPTPSVGSAVTTPIQLELSQADLDAVFLNGVVLPSLQGSITQTLPDFTITDPVTVKVSGLNLQFNYDFAPPELDVASGTWKFASNSLSADLVVNHIDATQVIQVSQGGTVISVTLNGSCSNVHLTLPAGAMTAQGTVQVDFSAGKPHFTLASLTSSWAAGSWQVASMNCQGPGGIDQLVSTTASTKLQQIDPFLDQIKTNIQSTLDQIAATQVAINFGIAPNVSLALEAQAFETLSGSSDFVKITGSANFNFSALDPSLGCSTTIGAFPSAPDAPGIEDVISLPQQALPALVNCMYLNHSLTQQFASTDLPAFEQLEHSWIEKFLFWPDLLNFKSAAPFDFQLKSASSPSLANLRSESAGSVTADMSVPMVVDMNAIINDQSMPYMHFYPQVDGPVSISVSAGQAKVTLGSGSKLSLSEDWDPTYTAQFSTNQRLWNGEISSGVKSFFKDTGLSFSLPPLSVNNTLGMQFQDLGLDSGGNIRLGIGFDAVTTSK